MTRVSRSSKASAANMVLVVASLLVYPMPAYGRHFQNPGLSADHAQASELNRRGIRHLAAGNYLSAATEFDKASRINPRDCGIMTNLGTALYYSRNFAKSREWLGRVIITRPDNCQAHYVLGLIAAAENKPDDAQLHFERVHLDWPEDPGTNYHLGLLRMRRKQFSLAIRDFHKTLAHDPEHRGAAYNLALCLARSGRSSEAEKWMTRFKCLKAKNPSGHQMGEPEMQYGEEGRFSLAVDHCP